MKELNSWQASEEAKKRIQSYLESSFFKQFSSISPKSFDNPRTLQLTDLEQIIGELEKTEYFAMGPQEKSEATYRFTKHDYESKMVVGDNGDLTRAFYFHLGRASLGDSRLIRYRKDGCFDGASELSDIFPNKPFFQQLEDAWNLLMLVEPDFLKIVGNPLKREVISYNTIEEENALLWPDFHVKDISGYGEHCSQRVIEPTAVKFTYPTNDLDFPNVYVLLSPTHTQSRLANKAIRYKPKTIARFEPCTTV